jgi:hypothetical protein
VARRHDPGVARDEGPGGPELTGQVTQPSECAGPDDEPRAGPKLERGFHGGTHAVAPTGAATCSARDR